MDYDDEDEDAESEPLPIFQGKNYMTPAGHAALQDELKRLLRQERPKIVEIVSWAAGNGDRSENGDYIYNKRRLREIDRRAHYLTRRLKDPIVVDPRQQQGLKQVYFGATVIYADDQGEHCVTLVGSDEADMLMKKINWLTPLAQSLLKSRPGDTVTLRAAGGVRQIHVISVSYGSV